MTERQTQVAVVGAGPAGMAAALELTARGLSVLVLDEGLRAGGQIFRQLPEGFAMGGEGLEAPSHRAGHRLLQGVVEGGVEVLAGTSVWDAAPGLLRCSREGVPYTVRAERILVAAGAYDRVVPFPGWTLPGVLTAGAAQVLVRGFAVRPGLRAVVAGTGPLLLPTVVSLVRAGVEVVAACEAGRRSRLLGAAGALLMSGTRLKEAWFYARALARAGVKLRWGWTAFAARGEGGVEKVVLGRVDKQGHPLAASAVEVEADVLCTGFGLVPQIELAQLLGCRLQFEEVRGGWVVLCDDVMKTTVDGVYVAGESAGIGGGQVAEAEGRLAGRAIAHSLGVEVPAGEIDRARSRRVRERRGADALLGAFPVPPGIIELADGDTVVCRCEDVTRTQVEAAAALFGRSVRAVKMGCRAGMGACQGRICGANVHGILGVPGAMPCPVAQVPARPVPAAWL